MRMIGCMGPRKFVCSQHKPIPQVVLSQLDNGPAFVASIGRDAAPVQVKISQDGYREHRKDVWLAEEC